MNQSNSTTDYCESTTTTRHLVFLLICTCMLVIGLLGNVLCVIVILGSRQLRSITGYYFLISLANANIGVLLFVATYKIDFFKNNLSYCHSFEYCVFSTFVDYLFSIAAAFHMTVIAVDRFIAITSPFFYSTHFIKKKVKFYILFVWLWCALWASLGIFRWDKGKVILIMEHRRCVNENKYYLSTMLVNIVLLPVIIFFWCYMHIFRVIQNITTYQNKLYSNKNKLPRKEVKAVKTVFIGFVVFSVCYVPHSTTSLLSVWTKIIKKFYDAYPNGTEIFLSIVYHILPLLDSCVNPFLYFVFGSQFRKAWKELYFRFIENPHTVNNKPIKRKIGKNKLFRKTKTNIFKLSENETSFSIETLEYDTSITVKSGVDIIAGQVSS
ncbi:trace amine-associated receptor 6 [Hydra vulgaris]|uniref:trace amine-associated receptor 6 n=1 Tax=Hydra vulgaris TaxID=6087 RepID=UPI001F5E6CF6|nr:trace amine-associated receptor 6-like [Hydra vulgaris]